MRPEIRIALLVARREFLTRARSRVWLIGTVLLVLGMSGYIVLQAKVISPSSSQTTVAFTGPAQALQPGVTAIATSLDVKLKVRQVASPADGAAKVDDGSLDALVSGDAAQPVVTVKETLGPGLAAAIGSAAKQVALNQALAEHSVDPAVVNSVVAAAGPRVHTLDAGAQQRTERDVAGIVVAILLYVSLLIYGQVVAAGVVEEKANRIVEILLSTIRARQLLIGKVLGIGLLGLIQLALVGGAGLLVSSRLQVISIPTLGVSAVAGGLLWFVLGFILYSLLYAAGASLVSRQEDLAAVTAPISVLVVGTYLAFFWVIANPTNPTAVTLSLLPPFAPVLMPARIATGDASLWQVAVAVALAIAAIGGLNWLAGRIYANSVLRLGSRVGLRQAWAGRS